MIRSDIIKSCHNVATTVDGDILETNLEDSSKATVHFHKGKAMPFNGDSHLNIRTVMPQHRVHPSGEGLNLCIPNYENYKVQIYPEAYLLHSDKQQFDTDAVLKKSAESNKVRVLWIVPIGTSLYAIVWRHTLKMKQGGPDGDPDSPKTTNSIFTTMSNATPEQIDNDLTLPLQMLYLCEKEDGPLVNHTFDKNLSIQINFGSAVIPDYKTILYSFTVNHNFIGDYQLCTCFTRDVTWELKWDEAVGVPDSKISGYSYINQNPSVTFPYTIYAHWYRCKYFNSLDEYQPWNWNNDNMFEYDFDHLYQPFYLFHDHPKSMVTNDNHCDLYAQDLTGGYPEYLCGAILTPDLIYMETQEYFLDYKQESYSYKDGTFSNDCDDDGTPETYSKAHFNQTETISQYVNEYAVCNSSIGLNFDITRYSNSNSVDYPLYCLGYAAGNEADLSKYGFCQFYDTNNSVTKKIGKFYFVPSPRNPRIRPQSLCDTLFFDFYDDGDVQLLLLGFWQTLNKGAEHFNYREKSTHQNNQKVYVYLKQKSGDWHIADSTDIPNLTATLVSLEEFIGNNVYTPPSGFSPNWDAYAQEFDITYYRNLCIFGQDAYLQHTTAAKDTITNVKKTQTSPTEWTYSLQTTPGIDAIQYGIRGIEGWNLSGQWYDYCIMSHGYWYDGAHYTSSPPYDPPYPIEQMINEVGCFDSWRTGKFPLFSLGGVLVTDKNMVLA